MNRRLSWSTQAPAKCDIKLLRAALALKYGYNHSATQRPGADQECPEVTARTPTGGSAKRVVKNVANERDVEIIAKWEVESIFPNPPKLQMSGQKLRETCSRMRPKWGQVCEGNVNKAEQFRTPKWWTCDYLRFVAKVRCAFIGRGGEVYDNTRVFSAHGIGFRKENYMPEKRSDVGGRYQAVAHHIYSTYPTATGHFFNQITRLFFLLAVLPEDVPILLPSFGLSDQLRKILVRSGVASSSKFIPVSGKPRHKSPGLELKPQYADTVYFAGEMTRCRHHPSCSTWYSLQQEVCSWQLALPRVVQREMMWCALGLATYSTNPLERQSLRKGNDSPRRAVQVLVVDRRDAKTRMAKNHAELYARLRASLPPHTIFHEYVGSQLSLDQQIRMFAWADIVVAPHGAALGLIVYMRPGGAVIELGYPSREMPLIFMATALSAGLEYYLSISQKGGHETAMVVDVDDAVRCAQMAYKAITGKVVGEVSAAESEEGQEGVAVVNAVRYELG